MTEKVSLKDIHLQLGHLQGQLGTMAKLNTQVIANEKDIVRLQEARINDQKEIDDMKTALKEISNSISKNQKDSQKILVAIGVVAILAGVFGDILVSKLLS